MIKSKLAEYHHGLKRDLEWQGRRLEDLNEATEDPASIAGAIAVSTLIQLRYYAAYKPLYPTDLQIAIDAFMEAGKLRHHETRMGGGYFLREGAPAPLTYGESE